jgi:hypothetical protein
MRSFCGSRLNLTVSENLVVERTDEFTTASFLFLDLLALVMVERTSPAPVSGFISDMQ